MCNALHPLIHNLYECFKPLMDKPKTNNLHQIEGYPLPVEIKRHAKARRIVLRVHITKARIVLTLPRRASVKESLQFLNSKKDWILAQIDKRETPQTLISGSELSILGETVRIVHQPSRRGTVLENDELLVSGDAEFLQRRVRDFLKAHAKKMLSEMARAQAGKLNKKISRIDVRDMHSHWGSCASDGRLCFSWRLILAPKEVCDYVVAHEVAHLVYLDHSAEFWRVVDALHINKKFAQAWLRKHGKDLFVMV